MKKEVITKIAKETILAIQKIDLSQLDISTYDKEYFNYLLSHIHYRFEIYTDAIIRLLPEKDASDYIIPDAEGFDYFVDFGGGEGFLSIFLKRLGLNVIYCDICPTSVNAIGVLKNEIGYGPDFMLEGSSPELLSFCKSKGLCPKYLIATDLIEHVYDLNALFVDFHVMNPGISMVFTTGSVKTNFLKCRKLRKIMLDEEKNLYIPVRRQFLQEKYPATASSEIEVLAKSTRGLIFSDMIKYVDIYLKTNTLPVIDIDRYNTCDPETGNWSERILSRKKYRKILGNHQFQVKFENGYYNVHKNHPVILFIVKTVNFFIRHFRLSGSIITPFIFLTVKKTTNKSDNK